MVQLIQNPHLLSRLSQLHPRISQLHSGLTQLVSSLFQLLLVHRDYAFELARCLLELDTEDVLSRLDDALNLLGLLVLQAEPL